MYGIRAITQRLALGALLLAIVGIGAACGKTASTPANAGPVPRSWGKMEGLGQLVGNMADTSYGYTRGKTRPNALGQDVDMASYDGQFVWAEYAAPWCSPCAQQARDAKAVDADPAVAATFIAIVTSEKPNPDAPATVATAKAWAGSYGLDPAHTLAADLWFKTIPEHRFYSPEGHTLFVHVGTLSQQQIRDVIAYYSSGYQSWKDGGEPAPWMHGL